MQTSILQWYLMYMVQWRRGIFILKTDLSCAYCVYDLSKDISKTSLSLLNPVISNAELIMRNKIE